MKKKILEYLSREKIHLTPVVVGYVLKNSRVLLGLRKQVTFEFGKNLISGIGGKLEQDETPEAALIREYYEEVEAKPVGFKKMGSVTFLFPHKPKWNQICTIYLISELDNEPKETDPIKPMWFDIKDLPKKQMWADNLVWLPSVLAGKEILGTFLYDENNKVIEYFLEVI